MTNFVQKNFFYIFFALFLAVHLVLFNINVAEWGDSYRILRASTFIREDFTYPTDEKRPPLFSAVLATYPSQVDPVFWSRIIMLGFSLASFVVFYDLTRVFLNLKESKGFAKRLLNSIGLNKKSSLEHSNKELAHAFALILFTFNPVYLYWSLRIMADVPFTFLTLLVIYLFTLWRDYLNTWRSVFLGFLVGLSVLTRFEGYILFGALGLGIVYVDYLSREITLQDYLPKNFFKRAWEFKNLISAYVLGFFVTLVPYFYFRNPFTSSYFEEPSGRAYTYNELFIYLASFLFLFGFISAFFFLVKYILNRGWLLNSQKNNYYYKLFTQYFTQNIVISSFLVVEFILILFWPAAIPRLFVPVIPFLIIPLTFLIFGYFFPNSTKTPKFKKSLSFAENVNFFKKLKKSQILTLFVNSTVLGILLVIYVLVQYFYKLQFLVVMRPVFIFLVIWNIFSFLFILNKNFILYCATLMVSIVVWSYSTIYIHKDIFKVVQEANVYITQNLQGHVAYNDVSSVSNWYLNVVPNNDVTGDYFDVTEKKNRNLAVLTDKGFDYVLITNEHNTDITVDFSPWPHLVEIKEFSHQVNGQVFFTKILKVDANAVLAQKQ